MFTHAETKFFKNQVPNGVYSETITSQNVEPLNHQIRWSLYNNYLTRKIDNNIESIKLSFKCHGVSICPNNSCRQCIDKIYIAPNTDHLTLSSQKCQKCNTVLQHKECNVSVNFVFESLVREDGSTFPTSITMTNRGFHDHNPCAKNPRKPKTTPQPYYTALVRNTENSCFIDAIAEMFFRSVLPFIPLGKIYDRKNRNDRILLESFLAFQDGDMCSRQLAFTIIRSYFRYVRKYGENEQGDASEVATTFLEGCSEKIKNLFTITSVASQKTETIKNHGPVIYTRDPLKFFSSKTSADSVPQFLLFSKDASLAPFRHDIQVLDATYVKHVVVYYIRFENSGHYYVSTTILHNESTFLAKIENLQSTMEILTQDDAEFDLHFNNPIQAPNNHLDVIICYKTK